LKNHAVSQKRNKFHVVDQEGVLVKETGVIEKGICTGTKERFLEGISGIGQTPPRLQGVKL
jgi:hypothetical protein